MVEVIMVTSMMFFFIGYSFEKVMNIAVKEWQEVRKESINE